MTKEEQGLSKPQTDKYMGNYGSDHCFYFPHIINLNNNKTIINFADHFKAHYEPSHNIAIHFWFSCGLHSWSSTTGSDCKPRSGIWPYQPWQSYIVLWELKSWARENQHNDNHMYPSAESWSDPRTSGMYLYIMLCTLYI